MAPALLRMRSLRRTSTAPALDTVRERSPQSLTDVNVLENDATTEDTTTGPDCASATTMTSTVSTGLHAQGRRRPTLRLDLRHCDEIQDPDPQSAAISSIGNVDHLNDRGAWCESPTELDGSFDFERVNIDNNLSTHSAPVPLRSPSPSTSPAAQTPQPKDRSASWTFGAIGRTPIPAQSRALASSVWSNLPSAKGFNKNKDQDADPCPTPKSILKKCSSSTDTSETASIMSGGTTSFWLTDSLSRPHSPTPTTSTRVSKRVTWSDPDVPPTRKPGRVSMNIRRHSADAVDRVAKVASNFASMALQNSIPRPRRRYVEEYEYWSSNEEEDERPPMPDIDWVAYGRAYTEEDALREFPLKREKVHVRTLPTSRSSSDTLVGSFRRRNFTADDDGVCHWDARRVVTPTWLLEGKYRPKSTRPVFEEDDEDVRAALLLPHDRPDSVALGIRASQGLLSSELLSSLESSTSLVDEALLTPSTSMLFPPASPAPGKPETTGLPDGAVVIVPKPMRVWPRPPVTRVHWFVGRRRRVRRVSAYRQHGSWKRPHRVYQHRHSHVAASST